MTWTLATISAVQNSARNPCPLQIRHFSAESRSLHLVVRALHSMLARVLSYPHQRAVSTSYSSSSITLMHFNLWYYLSAATITINFTSTPLLVSSLKHILINISSHTPLHVGYLISPRSTFVFESFFTSESVVSLSSLIFHLYFIFNWINYFKKNLFSRRFWYIMATETASKAKGTNASAESAKVPISAQPLSNEPDGIASNINYHVHYSPHFLPFKFEPEQAFFATVASVRDRLVQVKSYKLLCFVMLLCCYCCYYFAFLFKKFVLFGD